MTVSQEASSGQRGPGRSLRTTPAATISWDPDTEGLLRDWHNRAAAAATAHYKLAYRCRRRNVVLGVPAVISSAVVGTSLFATLNDSTLDSSVRLAIGSLSVVAAVLASLQTFLRFSERAERHVLAADWYAAVRRGCAEVLALPAASREPPGIYLPRLRKEMSRIGQQAPEVPSPFWAEVASSFHIDDTPPTRTVSGRTEPPSEDSASKP